MMRRAIILLALLCAPTFAEPPDDMAILSGLSNDNYEAREAMSQQLLSDETMTDDRINRLYARASSPEARQRLMDVALHHLLWRLAREQFGRSERASLGVNLGAIESPSTGQAATYVNRTLPGFPAFVALKPGDLILSIDGKRSEGRATGPVNFLIAEIQSRRPGDTVLLEIRRSGQDLKQKVTLSNFDALDTMYSNQDGVRLLPEGLPQVGEAVAPPIDAGRPLHPKFHALWIARLRQMTAHRDAE